MRHVVAKGHKNARVDIKKIPKGRYLRSLTYLHTRIHISKVNFFILFTSAKYGHIDSIDFPNMYTRTHERRNHIFIQLATAVFELFLSCLLWLLNCLFLYVCCCHIPFVYVLVKSVLYWWKLICKTGFSTEIHSQSISQVSPGICCDRTCLSWINPIKHQ